MDGEVVAAGRSREEGRPVDGCLTECVDGSELKASGEEEENREEGGAEWRWRDGGGGGGGWSASTGCSCGSSEHACFSWERREGWEEAGTRTGRRHTGIIGWQKTSSTGKATEMRERWFCVRWLCASRHVAHHGVWHLNKPHGVVPFWHRCKKQDG